MVTEGAVEGVVEDEVEAVVVAVAEGSKCKEKDRAIIDRARVKTIEGLKRGRRRARRQNGAYGSGFAYRWRHSQRRRPGPISNCPRVRKIRSKHGVRHFWAHV